MPTRKKTRGALRSPATRKPRRRGEADRTAEFETTLRESAAGQRYQLRLYVSGTSPRSGQAIANVRLLCDEFLFGRYDLEVIDIYQAWPRVSKSSLHPR
jgi:circadian clock protein KaiB